MSDETVSEPCEITITAKDARGQSASVDFEYTPKAPGVAEAVDDLRRGFIGSIDQRIKDVDSDK
jgi:hypothetical protein